MMCWASCEFRLLQRVLNGQTGLKCTWKLQSICVERRFGLPFAVEWCLVYCGTCRWHISAAVDQNAPQFPAWRPFWGVSYYECILFAILVACYVRWCPWVYQTLRGMSASKGCDSETTGAFVAIVCSGLCLFWCNYQFDYGVTKDWAWFWCHHLYATLVSMLTSWHIIARLLRRSMPTCFCSMWLLITVCRKS